MRGSNVFHSLFNDVVEVPCKTPKKGRNADYDALRNELLIYRYYYYGKFTKLRYTVIMNHLNREFFISPRTIADIISANASIMQNLKSQPPTLKALRSKYPHLVWPSEGTPL
jgi:hypothetical protein